MPDPVYLDNSSLIRWASGIFGSTEDRDVNGRTNLEAVVGRDRVVASPITLAEFNQVTNHFIKSQEGWRSQVDTEAVAAVETTLMKWLASGEIKVRPLGPRAFEMGMSYVTASLREHNYRFYAWDAIHLYEACRWAREIGEQVGIATTDNDFDEIIGFYPEFDRFVRTLRMELP